MPHVMSMNSVSQKVPRTYIAESITEERVEGYPTDPRSLERQFSEVLATQQPVIRGFG